MLKAIPDNPFKLVCIMYFSLQSSNNNCDIDNIDCNAPNMDTTLIDPNAVTYADIDPKSLETQPIDKDKEEEPPKSLWIPYKEPEPIGFDDIVTEGSEEEDGAKEETPLTYADLTFKDRDKTANN